MKNLYLCTSVALACALSLAACGGDDGNLILGGSIIGLSKDGLVLQNNGGESLTIPAGASYFQFPTLIGSDDDFNVTVQSSPSNAVCTAYDNQGKSGAYNVTSVRIICETFRYDLGGSVSGLDVDGLIINNGAVKLAIPAMASSFTMTTFGTDGKPVSGQVADGSPYGVTVFAQPAGRSCSVANGIGTMGAGPVTTIQITCI